MRDGSSNQTLRAEGFRLIGALDYRLSLRVWWHAERKIELIAMALGATVLIKGSMAYFIKSITDEGELWARDLGPMHEYLEDHFPEICLTLNHFRDVPPALADAQVRRKVGVDGPPAAVPAVEHLAALQQQCDRQRREVESHEALVGIESGESPLLGSYLRDESRRLRSELDRASDGVREQRDRVALLDGLQREYLAKGSAARLVFSVNSNGHVVNTQEELLSAVRSVVKELEDAHRFQINQKLGGRLGILAERAQEPVIVWIEHWLGGGLSPSQINRLGHAVEAVRLACEAHTMVTSDEDLVVDGHVKDSRKLVGARVVSSLLNGLDRPDPLGALPVAHTADAMLVPVGLLMRGDRVTDKEALVPLGAMQNAYVSGATGSGKSFLQRVIVEGAATQEGLSILVLDPRNQSVGLLVPEDRPVVLANYGAFRMNPRSAKGYSFDYYAPGEGLGEAVPADLRRLASARSIVSFKGMNDRETCSLFADILDAVFAAHSASESAKLRLLIVVEEAQRFTKRRVSDDAKAAAERAERALDRTAREGRKYGQCLVIVSQSIKDFAYESAAIRQNANTKIFLRSSDGMEEYAASFIDSGRDIVHLPTGTAIIHNGTWGTMRVRVKPALSKVWEFSRNDTRAILGKEIAPDSTMSEPAQRILECVRAHFGKEGSGMNLSQAAAAAGITSKRLLHTAIDELERAGLITTEKLPERGHPRVILPAAEADGADAHTDRGGAP